MYRSTLSARMTDTSTLVLPIDTPTYHAIPAAPGHTTDHAVTTHVPGWQLITEFAQNPMAFLPRFVSMYPRIVIHKKIMELTQHILEAANAPGQACLLFPHPRFASEAIQYSTREGRPDGLESLQPETMSVRGFEMNKIRVYAVFGPADKIGFVAPFWMHTGLGISSRLAEDCLKDSGSLRELSPDEMSLDPSENTASHQELRQRIIDLLERAPIPSSQRTRISPEDVYLSATGMTAIYDAHNCLLHWLQSKSKTVMFGFPFHTTTEIFKCFGPGMEFLPLGTELDKLEAILEAESKAGTPIQAVWTEFPSNPLLVSSDLKHLRTLADKYGFALVVDETVGSFCNVDVMPVADIIVPSLTKSFSGYADVMGGCAVLNPSSPLYKELKPIFEKEYRNSLYVADAAVLLQNSEDYLERSKILNKNAASVVEFLHSQTTIPESGVRKVHYPTVSPTKKNYDDFKRPETPQFIPGYGCLFSVEFDSVEATTVFYNNLHVHHGVHLGAHRTIALAYVWASFNNALEEVESHGLNRTQIRISVGLEDTETLLQVFKFALQAITSAKVKQATTS